ncbi:uncharacterized protein LOC106639698 [Copidosoma floridanum]|uniref:uncharacterized protein LOC106639698 n=1 Tax=Copidosoma floridanum TaxID=29053 RepID=UPI000C6F9CAF|nr:uncharacterized protein LOC106639698 [Copidosoma floridanum]
MPMKTVGGAGLGVVAGDIIALRGTGLAAAETWALLCQAAQALQDLFLSNGGVVGGSRAGPVVTPHTIELTARGRVQLLQAPPETARAYLPPEYRPGRIYSDTDSEKMWMYSLGRALLDTTPRATALTGTVSVSPSSALQSVLAAMTEPDPRRRASLMNLLDVISEYCRTRLQSQPFTHVVMDMYREVVRSAQYGARRRAVLQSIRSLPSVPTQQQHHQQQKHTLGPKAVPTLQNPPKTTPQTSRHRAAKGALFKAQSRNSRSQPNLLSLTDSDYAAVTARTTTKCSATGDIYEYYVVDARNLHQRTNSQPDCCTGERIDKMMSQAKSSTNLPAITDTINDADIQDTSIPQYGDPIYALPVKPFLSSQDVCNTTKKFLRPEFSALPTNKGRICYENCRDFGVGTTITQPTVSRCFESIVTHKQQQQTHVEDLYATSTKSRSGPIVLQRQHSSPQFPLSRSSCNQEQKRWEFANSIPDSRVAPNQQINSNNSTIITSSISNNSNIKNNNNNSNNNNNNSKSEVSPQLQKIEQRVQTEQEKTRFEARLPYVPRGPPPPKPPRINTSLKKAQAAQTALETEKLQRDVKNGPRARRGQAVQRAPSRLYRTVNGPARSFNKTQCVGPEFVVRANQPIKLLTVGDFKMSNVGRLTVILLTGQRLEVTCDPQKVTAGELFQAIVQTEGIEENFTLGLAALLAGDFAMLPSITKLNKVAPPGWLNGGKNKGPLGLSTNFMLYLRLRFFLPSLRGVRSWTSKHLLYLQLRRCILEQQLVCPLSQLINLTGLALQAEFGNYNTNMSNVGRLTVILLTGQRLEVTCDPQKVTAGELFQAIVQTEGIEENFTLGLAALLAGDFAMLPSITKLNKVAPPGWLNGGKNKGPLGLSTNFMLYLRLRFFLPSLRGVRSWTSKHLLYLQLRRCILEQQLVCPLSQLINLTGLALQAEFGNYNTNEHGCGDYFLLEHYVPESLILNSEEQQYRHPELPDSGEELRKRLQQSHRERRGLDANKAEEMFVTHAQMLTDYGAHYYIATVDTKEIDKIVARQKKFANQNQQPDTEKQRQQDVYIESENIYDIEKCSDYPIYGKIDFNSSETQEQNLEGSPYTDEQKIMMSKSPTNTEDQIHSSMKKTSDDDNNKNANISNNKSTSKTNKFKRSDSNVWLAIHSEGLKIFERGGRLRERLELAKFQWKDIQTLSYGKNYLMVYTRINGKRCKFKLRMDHRKSYYAFMLTSLHHQFFLKLRSELTSLQGLVKDFGVPLVLEPNSPQSKTKAESAKTKISIADTVKKQQLLNYPIRIEEQQNKENENPLKDTEDKKLEMNGTTTVDSPSTSPDENVLYAQVNTRLEPEGESRDTEDESDRASIVNKNILSQPNIKGLKVFDQTESDRLYNYANIGIPYADEKEEYVYTIPKSFSTKDVDELNEKIENPEDLYAAINKSGLPKKKDFTVPNDEQWKEIIVKKNVNVEKMGSSIFGADRLNKNNISHSIFRGLEVKTDSQSMYGSLVQQNPNTTDDLDLMSLKSETTSEKSTGSPMPEAYVLNTDLRTAEETFRIPNETMSTSLIARLDELSFAEERILRTIKLERGHGGSIGLQVTEGNDGGVYVQAVSVGGSADMAGNVNKGDRIVAINGQNLLNLGYEESLKLLQSSSETVELVLSQVVQMCDENIQDSNDNNYLPSLRFNVSSEIDHSAIMSSKWLQKTVDVASVQNTSSAYSSAASSAMGNHNINSLYVPDIDETNTIQSASMLLSLEDLDVSRTSTQQVFI